MLDSAKPNSILLDLRRWVKIASGTGAIDFSGKRGRLAGALGWTGFKDSMLLLRWANGGGKCGINKERKRVGSIGSINCSSDGSEIGDCQPTAVLVAKARNPVVLAIVRALAILTSIGRLQKR